MEKMRWFGLPWGAPVNESCERMPTPVGADCVACNKMIGKSDRGFIISHIEKDAYKAAPWHFACFMQNVLGDDWADQIFWQTDVCPVVLKKT